MHVTSRSKLRGDKVAAVAVNLHPIVTLDEHKTQQDATDELCKEHEKNRLQYARLVGQWRPATFNDIGARTFSGGSSENEAVSSQA